MSTIPIQRTGQERSPAMLAAAKRTVRENVIELTRKMFEMEAKATEHYNKFLQRKAEIAEVVDREYAKRETLGHTKQHIIDERVGKDTMCSSHAANNKWYISQATMYATMAQVETSRYREGLY